MGGNAPLVIQSMTSTNTNDIDATARQCMSIFDRGAHMVRLTAQSLREVESLKKIKAILVSKSYTGPLVADVHFQPKVAIEAARIVEKVRINPGNYISGKYTGPVKFDPGEQERQMGIIREKLLPLIEVCSEYDTVIRIGVNHGSLSERILNWYGDSPEGMVESALEFLKIFHDENFHKLVVSLKSSSARVMVYANRLLVKRMGELGYHNPIHLGVTEAGDEEEGRIKSTVGICSLLADGIGDTIRVSLTEEPEEEIPVAFEMAKLFPGKKYPSEYAIREDNLHNPFLYSKRNTNAVDITGGNNVPVVVNTCGKNELKDENLPDLGYRVNADLTIESDPTSSDYIFTRDPVRLLPANRGLKIISDRENNSMKSRMEGFIPFVNVDQIQEKIEGLFGPVFVKMNRDSAQELSKIQGEITGNVILVYDPGHQDPVNKTREFFLELIRNKLKYPVILHRKFHSENTEQLMIRAAAELGILLLDGFGDGIWIEDKNPDISLPQLREISFSILQASSARISKTEYISCPSCGRTLFNIQTTLKKIKDATSQFRGLKIAVMGCIVNGPGEMADADYGYVGAGPGKVSLYKGKQEILKNIPEEDAVDELLKLISQDQV